MLRSVKFEELSEQLKNDILQKIERRVVDDVNARGECVIRAETTVYTPESLDAAQRQLESLGYEVTVEGITYTYRRRSTR